MKTTKALFAVATVAASALLWAACTHGGRGAPGGTTSERDDIAGVVTGASGPEAGVWVIAETSDLPTKFAKIVVTDDQGRYLLPDLPQANYDVWVRGYGLVDSPKQRAEPGTTLNLQATPAPNPRAAAEYYPAGYWYSLIKVPAESEFPGTGPAGQRDQPGLQDPGGVRPAAEEQLLPGLPPDGEQGDARAAPRARHLRVLREGVGAAAAVRPGRRGDDRAGAADGPAHAADVRRLDRPDRGGRGPAHAAPPAGDRAQRRHHHVGLGRPEGVPARPGLDRPPQSDGQRQRSGLRRARGERRLHAGARPEDPYGEPRPGHAPRPEHPARVAAAGRGPSPYWGTEPIWTSRANVHNPMFDENGTRLDHLQGASAGQPGLLQGGVEPSVGPRSSRSTTRTATWRCTTRRRRR